MNGLFRNAPKIWMVRITRALATWKIWRLQLCFICDASGVHERNPFTVICTSLALAGRRNSVALCHTFLLLFDVQLSLDCVNDIVCRRQIIWYVLLQCCIRGCLGYQHTIAALSEIQDRSLSSLCGDSKFITWSLFWQKRFQRWSFFRHRMRHYCVDIGSYILYCTIYHFESVMTLLKDL